MFSPSPKDSYKFPSVPSQHTNNTVLRLTNSAHSVVLRDDIWSFAAQYFAPALCFGNVVEVPLLVTRLTKIYGDNLSCNEIVS
jgi:hypothetical protein